VESGIVEVRRTEYIARINIVVWESCPSPCSVVSAMSHAPPLWVGVGLGVLYSLFGPCQTEAMFGATTGTLFCLAARCHLGGSIVTATGYGLISSSIYLRFSE
jgi:hypothetical protein